MARLAHGIGAVAALSVAACGGSGSGASSSGTGLTLSLSTGALTFVAPNAGAPTPPSQTVSATISGSGTGTLYFLITSTGKAVDSISQIVITSSTTGRATVNPALPAILGIGVFKSSIIVGRAEEHT